MGGEVRWPIVELSAAGRAARSVADGTRAADLAGPTAALAAAMPGSRTAQTAAGAAQAWGRSVAGLADGMARHADAMTASASTYAATERTVSASLADTIPGAGPVGSR